MAPPLPENVISDIEAAYNLADNLRHALHAAVGKLEDYEDNPWWETSSMLHDFAVWADQTEDSLAVLLDQIDKQREDGAA